MAETVLSSTSDSTTLTLGTDSLIIFGFPPDSTICRPLRRSSQTTWTIPYYNILWAECLSNQVVIKYARPRSKRQCHVCEIRNPVNSPNAAQWVDSLLDSAYPPNIIRAKRLRVLINPFGGQAKAVRLWERECEPIFAAANCQMQVERTTHRGHAQEIARELDVDSVDAVVCASGDGIPHEVFNGLAQQPQPRRAFHKVAVAQIPCGSGNAMSLNLHGTSSPSIAAVAIIKGVRMPLDLVAITQGNNQFYSFLSQSVGIVAESDLGTESIRWMGDFRFTWGFIVRLLGKTVYPAQVSILADGSDKDELIETHRLAVEGYRAAASKELNVDLPIPSMPSDEDRMPPLRYGTIQSPLPPQFHTQEMPDLGNFYAGNMCWMSPDAPFFPCALPRDGFLDVVSISGLVSRLRAIKMMLSVEKAQLIRFHDVSYRKACAYRISPQPRRGGGWKSWISGEGGKVLEGCISIDGERVPFEPFQAEVLQGLATVLGKRRDLFEFNGVGV
ncbi:hypothetical protein K470DRAFT_255616 [Piedraia hortae CBS 480.64]|uniref:DAGKc domain-containing protein n=1 Tax=Piedraia hortae CBS 480.64 TaxID=1314780 RepID=A0A6A7C5H5_9PEZI|nr:hypothetical protein K470DRAFT_255616 [Piedraia hortae CBS 480.64]